MLDDEDGRTILGNAGEKCLIAWYRPWRLRQKIILLIASSLTVEKNGRALPQAQLPAAGYTASTAAS